MIRATLRQASRMTLFQLPRLLWLAVRARQADAVLVSFPKCGRTWLRLMLGMTYKVEHGLDLTDPVFTLGPSLSAHHADIKNLYVNHDVKPWMFHASRTKVILLIRNPHDVLVSSYYHSTARNQKFSGNLPAFIRSDRFGIQRYVDFYEPWLDLLPTGRVLVVRYESLKQQSQRELESIFTFLGGKIPSEQSIAQAIQDCTFAKMRQYEMERVFSSPGMQPGVDGDPNSYKTRQGESGRSHEQLSPEDRALITQRAARIVTGFSVQMDAPRLIPPVPAGNPGR